jgi:ABC-2 type transport system ATP-binding protein
VTSPAIELADVAVRRGHLDVLHGLTAQIPAGQVVGLLGPSGCGKTTLLRCIVGVQAHVRGRVVVLGRPAGAPELRKEIGYLTQAPAVYADLSVRQNLLYFARLLKSPPSSVEEVITSVGLGPRADRRVANLSGGERARASLASALLGQPQLLVLDEPTVGLDPVLRQELWTLFRTLAGTGVTLLVSSHVMDEAARCDRLLLMREGALLADEAPRDLLARTESTDLEQAFLRLVQS